MSDSNVSGSTQSDDRNNDIVVAFVTPCVDESFFEPVKMGARDAANALGVSCRFLGTPEVDIEKQIEIVRTELSDGCRAFALSIVHEYAYDGLLDELKAGNIPTVAFNVNAANETRLTGVFQNASSAGKTLGELVLPSVRQGSRILVTYHSEGISALDERRDGIMNLLGSRKIKEDSLVTGIDSSIAAEMVRVYLAENPDVRTVIGTGLADTEGAGLAIESLDNSGDYLLAGFDLSANILRLVKNGIIKYTIDQQPYVQGFYPVVQLVHMLRYGIQPTNIDAGAEIVSTHNVDSVIEQTASGHR